MQPLLPRFLQSTALHPQKPTLPRCPPAVEHKPLRGLAPVLVRVEAVGGHGGRAALAVQQLVL